MNVLIPKILAIVLASSLLGCESLRVSAGLSFDNGTESVSILSTGRNIQVREGLDIDGQIIGAEQDFKIIRKPRRR